MSKDIDIEDIYPLSPMQQGMLFESLNLPKTGVYVQLFGRMIAGDLNVEAMRQAWQQVTDRHPVLRTAFIWNIGKEPLQVVHRQRVVSWRTLDWRGSTPQELSKRLEELHLQEGSRGLTLSHAPLMRITIIRLNEECTYLLWAYHHLLLDGWSAALVIKEVSAFYDAYCHGRALELEHPRPYRDYIDWLRKQDLARARTFWQGTLRGLATPTSLGIDGAVDGTPAQIDSYGVIQTRMVERKTALIQSMTRRQHITLNTLAQGAWSVLLSNYSGSKDVVSGMVVAGRPSELSGVGSMVGLFINALPVRVQVVPGISNHKWLKRLQSQLLEIRQYEYCPLPEIEKWSEARRSLALFESMVVFQNYPVGEALHGMKEDVSIQDLNTVERTVVPLALVIQPDAQLSLTLRYDARRFEQAAIHRMLSHFQSLFESMATDPDSDVTSVSLTSENECEQLANAFAVDLGA